MNIGLAATGVMRGYAEMVVKDILDNAQLLYDAHGNVELKNDGTPFVWIETDDAKELAAKWVGALPQATSSGLPAVEATLRQDLGASAMFEPESWQIAIDSDVFANRGSLHIWECGELASTIYHEMRHAEQFWLMAYYVSASNPQMSCMEVRSKLAKTVAAKIIFEAMQEARHPRQDFLAFGKKIYCGEIGNIESEHKELFKLCKDRIQRLRSLNVRELANNDMERWANYKLELLKEIGDYNQRRPAGGLPKADETALREGHAFRVAALWWELRASSQNFVKAPDAYYRAYHKYLTAKRAFAAAQWKKAYSRYATSVTEHDAFAVEVRLKSMLKGKGLELDQGSRTVRMLLPVLWTASKAGPKPPPPIHSRASGLRPR